jgi:hypothetical protein
MAFQQQTTDDGSLATGNVRKMTTMFSKHDRPPTCQSPAQHRLKKRRALVCVQDHCAFTISKLSQTRCTSSINPGLPMEMFNNKSVFLKSRPDFTDLVQYRHDAAEFFLHAANHLIHKNLRTANSQRVDDMADRGTIVNRDDSKLSRGGLNHG